MSSTPVRGDWEERLSGTRDRVYYVNTRTGETQWEAPALPAAGASTEAQQESVWEERYDAKHSRPFWVNKVLKTSTWEMPQCLQARAATTAPLPEVAAEAWEERYDATHERVYFVNRQTRASVWVRPTTGTVRPLAAAPDPAPAAAATAIKVAQEQQAAHEHTLNLLRLNSGALVRLDLAAVDRAAGVAGTGNSDLGHGVSLHASGRSIAMVPLGGDLENVLMDALSANSVLAWLSLNGRALNGASIRFLLMVLEPSARPLSAPPSALRVLHLAHNRAGDSGAEHVATALAGGQLQLTELDLSDNGISGSGAQKLARALAVSQLTALDLSRNDLGDEGASAIVSATQRGSCMRAVHLRGVGISFAGADAIADALIGGGRVPTLSALSLDDNPAISAKGGDRLMVMVHTSVASAGALRKLGLSESGVAREHLAEIERALLDAAAADELVEAAAKAVADRAAEEAAAARTAAATARTAAAADAAKAMFTSSAVEHTIESFFAAQRLEMYAAKVEADLAEDMDELLQEALDDMEGLRHELKLAGLQQEELERLCPALLAEARRSLKRKENDMLAKDASGVTEPSMLATTIEEEGGEDDEEEDGEAEEEGDKAEGEEVDDAQADNEVASEQVEELETFLAQIDLLASKDKLMQVAGTVSELYELFVDCGGGSGGALVADLEAAGLASEECDAIIGALEVKRQEDIAAVLQKQQQSAALKLTRFIKYAGLVKSGKVAQGGAAAQLLTMDGGKSKEKKRRKKRLTLKGKQLASNFRQSMYEGETLHEGWLEKLSTSRMRKRWLRRYFSLRGHYMKVLPRERPLAHQARRTAPPSLPTTAADHCFPALACASTLRTTENRR